MSDDLRQDGEGLPDAGAHDQSHDLSSVRELLSQRLAMLQTIEEALAASSSRLAAMLSSISDMGLPVEAVAWVRPDADAPDGLGRIMLSRPEFVQASLTGVLAADSPLVVTNLAVASGHAANDNSVWVGDADGSGGVYGRDPSAATLADGDTVIAWIGEDNIVHAALYPAESEAQTRVATDQGLALLLANLGEAAPPGNGKDCGRLKLIGTGPNSFTAVWLAELGFTVALTGQIFSYRPSVADAAGSVAEGSSSGGGWSVTPLPPVPVKGVDAGEITVALNDQGGLDLGYSSTDETGNRVHHLEVAEVVRPGPGAANAEAHTTPLASVAPSGHGVPHHAHSDVPADVQAVKAAEKAAGDGPAHGGETLNAGHSISQAPGSATAFASVETVAELLKSGVDAATIAQTSPNIAITSDQLVHVLELVAGAKPEVATITIATLTGTGEPVSGADAQPQLIEVTDQALIRDTENPALDLTPDIAPVGEQIGIVWVQSAGPENPGATEIALQVYDASGEPASAQPVIVSAAAVDDTSDDVPTISSIAVAAVGANADAEHGSGAPPAPAADIAVAWVGNADPHGYGAVNLQLFDVHAAGSGSSENDASSGSIQALGADAQSNGDNDAPFQVTVDDEPAVGRDPQIEGVRGGAIAVAWVKPPPDLTPPVVSGVVSGVVIDGHNGHQLVALNLTALMPNGVAADSSPMLQTSSDGDIVIGWLQASDAGGYDAEAAVFKFVSDGNWQSPTGAQQLAHFAAMPDELSLRIVGDDTPQISLQWSDDGTSGTAHFDLDGHSIETTGAGDTTAGHCDLNRTGDHDAAVLPGDSAISDQSPEPVLPDAQFVVVFTQAGDASTVGAIAYTSDGNASTASAVRDTVEQLPLDAASAAAVATIVSLVATEAIGTADDKAAVASADAASTAQPLAQPLAEIDFAADTITMLTALPAGQPETSQSGTGQTGVAGDAYAAVSSFDIAATIEGYPAAAENTILPATHDGGASYSASVSASNDNFEFAFSADAAATPVGLDPIPSVIALDVVAAAFDALQLANALNVDAHDDVIVFDTSNVVTIRSLTVPPDGILG